MTTTINAVTSTGIAISGDGSGVIKVQSNGVTTNALAWVNFNGASPATIRASYNVSSVTRVTTGQYTVNFTNAMANVNYCAVFGVSSNATTVPVIYENGFSGRTTSSLLVVTYGPVVTALFDSDSVNVTIFGT